MLTPKRVLYRRRYLGEGIEGPENLTVAVIANGGRYESISLPEPTPFLVVVEPSAGPTRLCTIDGLPFRAAVPWRYADLNEVPGHIQELFDQMVDASLDRLETAEAERRVAETWRRYGKLDRRAALHCSKAFRDAMLERVLAEIRRRGLVYPPLMRAR